MVVPSYTVSKQLMTSEQDLTSQFIHVGIQGSKTCNATDKFKQLLDPEIANYNNGFYVA